MKREPLLMFLLSAVALSWALAGCGSKGADCGAGTVADGEGCSPVVSACGPGTVAVDGQCVPDAADAGQDMSGGTGDAGGEALPEGWTCPAFRYGEGIRCDCDCGAPDPDCAEGYPVAGCHSIEVACLPDGSCAEQLPQGWSCRADTYHDGEICNCDCGAPDPDCEQGHNLVRGCDSGICEADGTCGVCTPQCDGRSCGGDGCGGSCGQCFDPTIPYCHDGACVAECVPSCGDHTCGADGCGGQCGVCEDSETCTLGHCEVVPEDESCVGRCGEVAPAGCSCAFDCVDCCVNVQAACTTEIPDGACPPCFEDALNGGTGCPVGTDLSACLADPESFQNCGDSAALCADPCGANHCQVGEATLDASVCRCGI